MKLVTVLTALAGFGFGILIAQETAPAPVFSAAQVEAGRAEYLNTCVKCHTDTLRGRNGDPGEMPPVSSLPEDMQKTIRDRNGKVPPLAGPYFLARWGERSAGDLAQRIKEAVGGFPPDGKNDETFLNITAYVLQVNGGRAGAQPLTATTAAEVSSLVGKHQ